MFFSTVCRWVRHLSADVGPVQVLLNLVDLNLQVVQRLLKKYLVKSDARYTSQRIADMVEISKAYALCFWRNILKLKKESTRWVPHLLDEEQKCVPVRTVRKLLKRFPRYDQKIFMNVIVDDESWIHYFKPHRKISNRVWITTNARRHCIATRITNAKNAMSTIFLLLRA